MDTSQKVEATLELCKIINCQHAVPQRVSLASLSRCILVKVDNERRLEVVACVVEQVLYVLS